MDGCGSCLLTLQLGQPSLLIRDRNGEAAYDPVAVEPPRTEAVPDGHPQQLEIARRRSRPLILYVKPKFLRQDDRSVVGVAIGGRTENRFFITECQACQVRDAWSYFERLSPAAVSEFDILRNFRPGPDQAHVALNNVDQLRQLVDFESSQPRAGPRNAA